MKLYKLLKWYVRTIYSAQNGNKIYVAAFLCPCANANSANLLSTCFGSFYSVADCLMRY